MLYAWQKVVPVPWYCCNVRMHTTDHHQFLLAEGAIRRSCAGGRRGGRKNNHPPIVQRQFLECVQVGYVRSLWGLCGGMMWNARFFCTTQYTVTSYMCSAHPFSGFSSKPRKMSCVCMMCHRYYFFHLSHNSTTISKTKSVALGPTNQPTHS